MLRRVDSGWRFLAVSLALALLFMLLWTITSANILVQILNGLYFGTLVSIVTTYGRILVARFFGGDSYNRAFHYSVSVMMLWVVATSVRIISVWRRVFDQYYLISDNMLSVWIAYLTIVAIIWQALVVTEDARHDRHVLFWSSGAGMVVAAVLVALQEFGLAWVVRLLSE